MKYLDRREQTAYLKEEHNLTTTPGTLSKLASTGGGPKSCFLRAVPCRRARGWTNGWWKGCRSRAARRPRRHDAMASKKQAPPGWGGAPEVHRKTTDDPRNSASTPETQTATLQIALRVEGSTTRASVRVDGELYSARAKAGSRALGDLILKLARSGHGGTSWATAGGLTGAVPVAATKPPSRPQRRRRIAAEPGGSARLDGRSAMSPREHRPICSQMSPRSGGICSRSPDAGVGWTSRACSRSSC